MRIFYRKMRHNPLVIIVFMVFYLNRIETISTSPAKDTDAKIRCRPVRCASNDRAIIVHTEGQKKCLCKKNSSEGSCQQCVNEWLDMNCKEASCEFDIDEMLNLVDIFDKRKNGIYQCITENGEVNCVCRDGWSGNYCELCDDGFIGDDCKKDPCRWHNDILVSDSHICGENAVCTIDDEGMARCSCSDGWSGDRCQKCDDGFIGDDCKRDPCRWHNDTLVSDSDICGENGKCIIEEDGRAVCICKENWSGDFCKQCSVGLIGQDCNLMDPCRWDNDKLLTLFDICGKNGKCVIGNDQKAKCFCNEGWNGDFCQQCADGFIGDDCKKDPCRWDNNKLSTEYDICGKNGKCIIDGKETNCVCNEGWNGDTCERCDDGWLEPGCKKDPCRWNNGKLLTDSYNCGEEATCNPMGDAYTCTCDKGKWFDHVQLTCQDIDLCPMMQCDENMHCKHSECICNAGFVWSNLLEKCQVDICYYSSLNNCSQICEYNEENFACSCFEGYEMKDGECVLSEGAACDKECKHPSVCVKKEEKIDCECPTGFHMQDGQCADNCMNDAFGICRHGCNMTEPEGPHCICEGVLMQAENGVTCEKIPDLQACTEGSDAYQECEAKSAVCEDIPTDEVYRCVCPEGKIEVNGTCVGACSPETNPCPKRASRCLTQRSEVKCECNPGYYEVDGNCIVAEFAYVGSLTIIANGVGKKEKIENLYNEVSESMRALYGPELKAVTLANIKWPEERYASSDPHIRRLLQFRSNPLQTEVNCDIVLSFATDVGQLERISDNETCQSYAGDNSSKCLIPPSLLLSKPPSKEEIFKQYKRCQYNVCPLSAPECVESTYGYSCKCVSGFLEEGNFTAPWANEKRSQTIAACHDIDECTETPEICGQHAECYNTFGSFGCLCQDGFKKTDNKGCADVCEGVNCNNGKCQPNGNSFYCRCDPGFGGDICDGVLELPEQPTLKLVVVIYVLGAILLIIIIVAIVFIIKFRNRRNIQSEPHLVDDYLGHRTAIPHAKIAED